MSASDFAVLFLALVTTAAAVFMWAIESEAAVAGNPSSRRPCVVAAAIALALWAILLAGCAPTPPVREVTVTKEVPVPYHQPCPDPKDKPVVPKHVAEEHPVMPADEKSQIRILADKILELFGYAAEADGVMTECSKAR